MVTIAQAFRSISPVDQVIDELLNGQLPQEGALTPTVTYFLGDLTAENVAELDTHCLVAMLVFTKQLSTLPPHDRSWQTVMSRFYGTSFIKPMNDRDRTSGDTYRLSCPRQFKADASTVHALDEWYTKLVGRDVRDATLKDGAMEKLAKGISLRIDSTLAEGSKAGEVDVCLLDVVVVRYPDPKHRSFELYTIKLRLIFYCRQTQKSVFRWLRRSHKLVGPCAGLFILGEFSATSYEPREDSFRGRSIDFASAAYRETLIPKGVRLLDEVSK